MRRRRAAAVTLFARHGFAATGMRDVASAAGLSAGSIYRHDASKDELFSALVGQAMAGLGELIEGFRSGGSPAGLINPGDPAELPPGSDQDGTWARLTDARSPRCTRQAAKWTRQRLARRSQPPTATASIWTSRAGFASSSTSRRVAAGRWPCRQRCATRVKVSMSSQEVR